ncbi:MAG: hypothetical protein RIF46_08505 [Cyclobacteriaceae bacterium]
MKWQKDTLYYYEHGVQESFSEKAWNLLLREMSTLSGITLIPAVSHIDSDIIIYHGAVEKYLDFIDDKTPRKLVTKYSNWSMRKWERETFALSKASFCVDSNKMTLNSGKFYLTKNLLKTFGLLGDLEDSGSILYKGFSGPNHIFGRHEKRLLKMLYHENVLPGKKKEEIVNVFDIEYLENLAKEKL